MAAGEEDGGQLILSPELVEIFAKQEIRRAAKKKERNRQRIAPRRLARPNRHPRMP